VLIYLSRNLHANLSSIREDGTRNLEQKDDKKQMENPLNPSLFVYSYFLSLRRTGELDLGRRCKSIIDNDLIGTDDALGTQEPDRGVDIKPSGEHGEWRCSGSSCSSMLILLLLLELLLAKVTKEFLLKLASLLGGAVS